MVRFLLKGSVGLIIFGIMISACGPTSDSTATPTSTIESCTPLINDYMAPVESRLVDIYKNAVTVLATNSGTNSGMNDYNEFRKQAFNELVNRVYDWSDSADVKTGEKTVRITVTYISPELTHIILLNHYLYKAKLGYKDTIGAQIQNDMAGILARNEHIFFIVLTTSQYDNAAMGENTLRVNFPIKSLELTNVENMTVKPERDDHNLENNIPLTEEPAYGFFYYPMATRTKNSDCKSVLDQNRDTRIVLIIPFFSINGIDYGRHSWEYTYAPLLKITSDSGMKKGKFFISPNIEVISPNVSKVRSTTIEDPEFWVNLARLIWFETTHDL